MNDPALEFDVLVIGGGMGGLVTGARVAQAGRRVLLVEKSPALGGSAALSQGYVWTGRDVESFFELVPRGDPEHGRRLVAGHRAVVEWMRSIGVDIASPADMANGLAVGFRIDVLGLVDRCRRIIEGAEGWIVCGADVRELMQRGDTIVGARVEDREGVNEILAAAVVLATGGFQASPVHRERYIRPDAGAMLVRSNPISAGDGIDLALSVGAELSASMDQFYGHLIAHPISEFGVRDYLRLAQTWSPDGLLLDAGGHRFVDESMGYAPSARAVLDQPGHRALLVADQRVAEIAARPPTVGVEQTDKFPEAAAAGAHTASAPTPALLGDAVAEWGYDPTAVAASIEAFNRSMGDGTRTDPERRRCRQALDEPPYWAVEVQPAITTTWGGLRVDASSRVRGRDGQVIKGLFAVGADAGGVFGGGYAGGLAWAAVSASSAAEAILAGSRRADGATARH